MLATNPPQIWIVDDDEDDQMLFESAFIQLLPIVTITTLSDGDELLPSLDACDRLPDLVLLDINMPRLDGFEALRTLRTVDAYQTVPVVLFSTSAMPRDQERAHQLGASGFQSKPPTMDKILELFRGFIEQWHLYAA